MGRKYRQQGPADPPWMVVHLRASRLGECLFSVQGKLGISEEEEVWGKGGNKTAEMRNTDGAEPGKVEKEWM